MNRLRELRKIKGLTQKEVAKEIGVSPQSYGYYENWINKPDPDMLGILADFFGCSIDYLLGREDDFGNVVIPGQTSDRLTEKEERLLNAFSKLSDNEKNKIIYDAEFFAEKHKTVPIKK